MKVLVMKPDANAEVVEVEKEKLTLEWLQEQVGGYIEAVHRPDDDSFVMYGDEEAKLKGKLGNVLACMTADHFGWEGRHYGDYLAGTVIVLGTNVEADEDEGEEFYLDVPDAIVEFAQRFNIIVVE